MFLTAPSTFFDAPLMILKNSQTYDDAPLPSKASKVIYGGRPFQNHLKSTFPLTYGGLRDKDLNSNTF
jgi:hypothetical protein